MYSTCIEQIYFLCLVVYKIDTELSCKTLLAGVATCEPWTTRMCNHCPPPTGSSRDNDFSSIRALLKALHCGNLLRVVALLFIIVNSRGVYLRNISSLSTIFKDLLLQNHWADQSQISYGASVGWGNESLFARSGSHGPRLPPHPYMVKTLLKSSSPEPKG